MIGMRHIEAAALNETHSRSWIELGAEKMISLFKKEAISGDDYQALIDPLKKNLYNMVLKSMNYHEDAGDVYQEILLRGFKYIYSLRDAKDFRVWIYSIAHNEIKRYFSKHREVPLSYDDTLEVAETNDRERLNDIRRIAAALKPRHREVFYLYYYNEFSLKEISGITGLKEGNLKFILHKARSEIKKVLGEQP